MTGASSELEVVDLICFPEPRIELSPCTRVGGPRIASIGPVEAENIVSPGIGSKRQLKRFVHGSRRERVWLPRLSLRTVIRV